MVLDLAAVDAGAVPDGHIVSDDARVVVRNVQAAEVLDVRTDADGDVVYIAACDDTRPETGVLPNAHITREEYLRGDERLLVNLRRDAVKTGESIPLKCKHRISFLI